MTCERWTDALSAAADGEELGVDRRLLDAHLAQCASCRAFAAQLSGIASATRLTESPTMPDLSRRVAKVNAVADRAGSWTLVRLALAATAAFIVVRAAPALVLGHDDGGTSHAARHAGAFAVAYAVGLAVVVVRPARARTILPVAMVTALALAVTAVVDATEGHIPLLTEATHLPELFSVVLVWLLARPSGPATRSTARPTASTPAGPDLRVVDDTGPRGSREAG